MESQSRKSKAIFFILAGSLLIVGAIAFVLLYKPPVISKTSTVVPTPEETSDEIQRVSLGDAKAAYELGTAVFIDVRSSGSYNESHIPGAISIPLSELTTRLNELDHQAWIITYCT